MLIVCPNCATSYKVEETNLGSEGRTVRCARCKAAWFAAATASTHALALHAPAMADVGSGPRDGSAAPSGPPSDWEAGAVAVLPPEPFPQAVESDSPPLVPAAAGEEGAEARPSDDIESVDAKRQAQLIPMSPARPSRRPRLAFYIPVLLAIIVAAMAARTPIVRQFPQTASLFAAIGLPVNLRGLEFDDVVISNEIENDTPVMVVRGKVRNITTHKVRVPYIRFGVRNNANVEVYAWTAPPDKATLAAGEALAFRSQLVSPPPEAQTVAVRFADAHDRGPGR